ncbi:unnamed protein product [Didymodactylos carnosus]|uniref:Cytochrome P450 n=1 Tax=Didymodactylos carnosus TaxID=1234261 RepID=A0A814TAT0_9BILA|nr:unnamed protein product [Didymodactylos carnosus]CAF3922978.1 unnamed protein product [Didymodactylos carnosus]
MLLTTFLLTFALLSIVYLYLKRKYFTLVGPLPGLPPRFLFGNLLDVDILKGEPLVNVYAKLQQTYGDVCQFWAGPDHFYMFSKVEHFQHIFTHRNIYDLADVSIRFFGLQMPSSLLAIKGEQFKRHARVMLPMFKKNKVISHVNTIIDCTDKLIHLWRHEQPEELNENIVQQSKSLLLDIIGFIAFDYDLQTVEQSEQDEKKELTKALNIFINMHHTIMQAAFVPTILFKWWLKLNLRYQNALKTLQYTAYSIIAKESEYTGHQVKPKNLISMLVSSLQKNEEDERKKSEVDKYGLSRAELLDEILLSIGAGFETTSTALAWFIYYMSKHAHIQEKIKQELRANNIMAQTYLNIELLDKLTYVDCVMKEVLRYAPIIDCTVRTLTQDDEIDGIKLKKGESVLMAFYNVHMDKRYWNLDPQQFIPERFLSEDKNHHPLALGTFGGGHRACAGQDLARLELKIIITRLMQYVTFIDGGQEKNSGGKQQSLTCTPKNVAVYIQFD